MMRKKLFLLIVVFLIFDIEAQDFNKIFKEIKEIKLYQDSKHIIGSIYNCVIDNNFFYIVDSRSSNIKIYDLDGKLVKVLGNKGNGPGEFQLPKAIDIDDKYIYVTDVKSRKLNIFDKKTLKFKKSFYIVDGRTIKVIGDKILLSYLDVSNNTSLHFYNIEGKLLNESISIPKITLDNKMFSDLTSFDVDKQNNIYFVHEMKYEILKGKDNKFKSFITREEDKIYLPPPKKPFKDFFEKDKASKWLNSWSHVLKLIVSDKNDKLMVEFTNDDNIFLDIYNLNGKLLYKNIKTNMHLMCVDKNGYLYFLKEDFKDGTIEFIIKKYSFR